MVSQSWCEPLLLLVPTFAFNLALARLALGVHFELGWLISRLFLGNLWFDRIYGLDDVRIQFLLSRSKLLNVTRFDRTIIGI